MSDFAPVARPLLGETEDGARFAILGWRSDDGWINIEPVVANPDGPGVGPWHLYYGEDNWRLVHVD